MIKAKVDDKYGFLIDKIEDQFIVDGKKQQVDVKNIDNNTIHIIHENRSYKVNIIHADPVNKTFELRINGHRRIVELKDESDQLLEKINFLNKKEKKVDVMKAPMAGLIMDIKVKVDQEVNEGDPLIILKAMKMENILKSPQNGTIRKIYIEENQKVEKDALIIQF